MVAALYRRYRPETFAELIGQSQVTDPLRTALRADRVNHAYLFSGPRGCGKTTSARILARCLNCAEGPTDTPCGVCPSCVELSRDGGGSLDVVEIDAASHNGVDDARDLRERAVFAPARDRFKIFILDEAHMVTPQGFNALLKIVEEPPDHVKFIFATTEPEKVIGTIRSRTHHYPFRLVPPAQLLEYVQQLCVSENVEVEPGVLPLVVRAGGGSVRDTLSLLDQLMAGSEGHTVEYERTIALLGYTHGALLDEVVDAISAQDAAAVFGAVDRVIQTGQDPRRFVEDLLERLRDLIIVSATKGNAAAVLRGVPQDELDRMISQAATFGSAELSRCADVVNSALSEMTGATSPRLHLELMVARILVQASDDSPRGTLARVERLERRLGVDGDSSRVNNLELTQAAPSAAPVAAPVAAREPRSAVARDAVAADVATATSSRATPSEVSLEHLRNAWPEILDAVQKAKMSAWTVVFTSRARALDGDVLTLSFPSQNDVESFKQPHSSGDGVSEILRRAIVEILGIRVKFIARADAPAKPENAAKPESAAKPDDPADPDDTAQPDHTAQPDDTAPDLEPAASGTAAKDAAGWAVAEIPAPAPPTAARQPRAKAAPKASAEPARYGESVVRELLGASFIEEQTAPARVIPTALDD